MFSYFEIDDAFRAHLRNAYPEEFIDHMDMLTYAKEYLAYHKLYTPRYNWGMYTGYWDEEGVLMGDDGLYIYENACERANGRTTVCGPYQLEEFLQAFSSYTTYHELKTKISNLSIEDLREQNTAYNQKYMFIPEDKKKSVFHEIYEQLYLQIAPASYSKIPDEQAFRMDKKGYYFHKKEPMSATEMVRYLFGYWWMWYPLKATDKDGSLG